MSPRERLHQLVEALPETERNAAEAFLGYLRIRAHERVRLAFEDALLDGEPLTAEEEAAIAEARRELARGDGTSLETPLKRLSRAG